MRAPHLMNEVIVEHNLYLKHPWSILNKFFVKYLKKPKLNIAVYINVTKRNEARSIFSVFILGALG